VTGTDYDPLLWHDCTIWGIEFRVDDETSDLAFDIDYIDEWMRGPDDMARFRVMPAYLVFHGVTDPKIDVSWLQHGFQISLRPLSIARVDRELIPDAKVFLDRAYYKFRLGLNGPENGAITFGSVGFSIVPRGVPIVSAEQTLTRRMRNELIALRPSA
jgi:hypothetical protein